MTDFFEEKTDHSVRRRSLQTVQLWRIAAAEKLSKNETDLSRLSPGMVSGGMRQAIRQAIRQVVRHVAARVGKCDRHDISLKGCRMSHVRGVALDRSLNWPDEEVVFADQPLCEQLLG